MVLLRTGHPLASGEGVDRLTHAILDGDMCGDERDRIRGVRRPRVEEARVAAGPATASAAIVTPAGAVRAAAAWWRLLLEGHEDDLLAAAPEILAADLGAAAEEPVVHHVEFGLVAVIEHATEPGATRRTPALLFEGFAIVIEDLDVVLDFATPRAAVALPVGVVHFDGTVVARVDVASCVVGPRAPEEEAELLAARGWGNLPVGECNHAGVNRLRVTSLRELAVAHDSSPRR